MSERPTLSQKYESTSRTLQSVVEALTRIDERVALFIQTVNDLGHKLDHHMETCPAKNAVGEMLTRLTVLESKNGRELKEAIKELKDQVTVMDERFRDELKDTNEKLQELAISHEKVSMASNAHSDKWKTVRWVALNILVPAISVTIATVILYYLFGIQNNIPVPVKP